MKRTRENTIAYYRDEMLKDKSEEFIANFNSKDINKQYAAIMNWKRSLRKKENSNNEIPKFTFSAVLKYLKDANNELENLSSLSAKEAAKASVIIDEIKYNIENFDKIKKKRILAELKHKEEQINKEGEALRKKITELQNEVG